MEVSLVSKINDIIKSQVCNSDILTIYPYGSRVYGTNRPDSDYDFIVITKTPLHGMEITFEDITVHLYGEQEFLSGLQENQVHFLECIFLPANIIYGKQYQIPLIDSDLLRRNFSLKSSNSFVKAKKKITLPSEDSFIGLKSLFHSLRILDFGIQIAKNGSISDYTSANHHWFDIMNIGFQNGWEPLKLKYQPIHNVMSSDFRKVAPKKINHA